MKNWRKLQLFLTDFFHLIVSQEAAKNDMQNILGELEKLKSYLNNVELQLYEANEHISDLLEKVKKIWNLKSGEEILIISSSVKQKQELEVENLSLKSQNAELTNLTKLMQSNMYETLNTSKRWDYYEDRKSNFVKFSRCLKSS